MKKRKKVPKITILMGATREFHIHVDSGENGYQHEYTVKVQDSESGTFYSMEYSNSDVWSEELREVNIFHLENNGNGYEWIDTDPMGNYVDYDEFFRYTLFMRVIQYVESNAKFSTKILEINEVETFNF